MSAGPPRPSAQPSLHTPAASSPLASEPSVPGPAAQEDLQGSVPRADSPTSRADLEASLPPCPVDWLAKGLSDRSRDPEPGVQGRGPDWYLLVQSGPPAPHLP